MKNFKLTFILSIFLGIIFASSAVMAEHHEAMKGSDKGSMKEDKGSMKGSEKMQMKGAARGEMDEETMKMMKAFEAYATPNENHFILDQLVGDWAYTMKYWMDPNAPAEESSGTSSTKWIMNKRFIQNDVSGTSMGKPFNGRGITGFDNLKQKYSNIWFDDMSTGMMVGEGTFDPVNKTITDEGDFSCPMVGGQRRYKSVITFIDDKSYKYEMYMGDMEGHMQKAMEIIYTRT